MTRAAVGLVLAALAAAPAHAGAPLDYMLECQGCHLPDGRGAEGSVPDLRGRIGLFLRVPGGRAYLVRVPGSSSSSLTDARLAAVLNWMVERFGPAEVAADFAPFDAAEVRAHRRPPLSDVQTVRRELIRAIDALP